MEDNQSVRSVGVDNLENMLAFIVKNIEIDNVNGMNSIQIDMELLGEPQKKEELTISFNDTPN